MSRNFICFTLLLCCGFSAGNIAPAQAAPSAQQQAMIAADRGIFEALSEAHADITRLDHLLAPEYTEVDDGTMHSRADLLRQAPHASQLSFQYTDAVAVSTSADTGYVIAAVRFSFSNGLYTRRHFVRTTTNLAQRDGRWVVVFHTEEPMPFDPEAIRATPQDSDPSLIAMRSLAANVMSQVHVPGYAPFPYYPVSLDAGMGVSFSDSEGAHEADFTKLPPPMQQIWTQWASYTTDESSGAALFQDMFYRFFLVHELGHLIAHRVMNGLPEAERQTTQANESANAMEKELVPNRIAVAWFREHDPEYLARLVADFRRIEARLPNPVPAGEDPKRYFTQNYLKLAADPLAYGWYQNYMVIIVYDEPAKTFQQTLAALPNVRYTGELAASSQPAPSAATAKPAPVSAAQR